MSDDSIRRFICGLLAAADYDDITFTRACQQAEDAGGRLVEGAENPDGTWRWRDYRLGEQLTSVTTPSSDASRWPSSWVDVASLRTKSRNLQIQAETDDLPVSLTSVLSEWTLSHPADARRWCASTSG